MKNKPATISFLLSTMLLSQSGLAATCEGVKFPDQVKIGTKTLQLNGTQVRTKTVLKVKVYAAGLYVEQKSKDADAILKSPGLKRLDMQFMRDVEADKIKEAWSDSYHDICEPDCVDNEAKLTQLNSYMTDMKEGDKIEFVFSPEQVEVKVKGEDKGVIKGVDYSKILLSTWLGKKPPTEDLKNGLLGLKACK